MNSSNDGARQYFDSIPKQWDAIYANENWLEYQFNRCFRPGIFNRLLFAIEQSEPIQGATMLDIGCGSGRASIEFAKRGAKRVVGIDFAQAMVEFSGKTAEAMGVADRCEFLCGDFLQHPFQERFDIVLALGLFDYIEHPEVMFKKVAQLDPRVFIASFPKFTPFWGLQRHIRYQWIRRCPIYNFTRKQIEALCAEAGFESVHIVEGGRGLMLRAGKKA